MSSTGQPELNAEKTSSRWAFLFSWSGLIFIGWALYELSSEASLGVTVLCCKFGWDDFSTAIWLRCKDPEKPRGKIAFWIFMASGLLKTAISGFIVMMVLVIVTVIVMGPAAPGVEPADEFMHAGQTAMAGFLLSSLATFRSVGLAVWHQQKIWLDSSVHSARRHDTWPPPPGIGTNQAAILIKSSFIVLAILIILAYSMVGIVMLGPGEKDAELEIGFEVYFCVFTGMLVGLPILLLAGRDFLQRNLLASSPSECWKWIPQPYEDMLS